MFVNDNDLRIRLILNHQDMPLYHHFNAQHGLHKVTRVPDFSACESKQFNLKKTVFQAHRNHHVDIDEPYFLLYQNTPNFSICVNDRTVRQAAIILWSEILSHVACRNNHIETQRKLDPHIGTAISDALDLGLFVACTMGSRVLKCRQ